jgi:hypothetical protein
MVGEANRSLPFTDAEITAAFLSALEVARGRNGHGKRLSQDTVTSLLGRTPASMSQWKSGGNIAASTLVAAFVRLDVKLILDGFVIGLCGQEKSTRPNAQESAPEQLSLFLDYSWADEPAQNAHSRQVELDRAEEIVLRLSVRRALAPAPDAKRECA